MQNLKVSASLENYLEAILEISKEKETVRPIEIAKKLHISKASVTEALRLLSSKELVIYKPYEPVELTSKGIILAKKVTLKHEILFSFLSDILGIEEEEAKQNACKIEHVISENVLEKLTGFLEFYKASDCLKEVHAKELENFNQK